MIHDRLERVTFQTKMVTKETEAVSKYGPNRNLTIKFHRVCFCCSGVFYCFLNAVSI